MNKGIIISIVIGFIFFIILSFATITASISQQNFEKINEQNEKNNDFDKLIDVSEDIKNESENSKNKENNNTKEESKKEESKKEEPKKEEPKSDLELINYEATYDEYYIYVIGKIKNNTSKNYSYVQVQINLYDENENVIGSTLDNMNNLGPGETWSFKAMITDKNAASYRVTDITGF